MRYLFELPGKGAMWKAALARCRSCGEDMYSRQAMVWHAKRHALLGEAELIAKNIREPITHRYRLVRRRGEEK